MINCSIFWDNSNLFAGARDLARDLEGPALINDLRVHYEALWNLARAGRNVSTGVCVASSPLQYDAVRDKLAATGMVVEMYERGPRTHGENAVDQALQVHMLRALIDRPPGVAVLLTGDGAGYTRGEGFLADLERMHKGGWGIEVLAWENCCHKHLKRWATQHGLFVPLDDYYANITYLKGIRAAKKLSHLRRNLASPRTLAPTLQALTA